MVKSYQVDELVVDAVDQAAQLAKFGRRRGRRAASICHRDLRGAWDSAIVARI